MKIYSSTETNFTRNGYGFLNDCIESYVEETLNGAYTLYFEYPINAKLSEYLVEQNIVSANVSSTNEQLFRIYRVEKDFEIIKVYCNHISYDLNVNMLMDVYPKNKSVQEFGTWLLDNTQYVNDFTFYSDINKTGSARYIRKNPIECIIGNIDNSMVNLFGGELERDNFTIKLLAHRGQNNHVKLLIGKNITEIDTNVDITNLYTRVIPVGFDGLVLPERFVDSPLINSYPSPRICKIEFSNIKYDPESTEEGVYTNIEDAYTALRNAVNALYQQGLDKPQISIKVDWLELSKTEQYKNAFSQFEKVNLGDTITASILGIDYTTQVVKTKYNVLSDTIESFEIGTIQQSITNTINFTQNEIEKINPTSILEDAKQSATNLINNALSGYIYLDYEHGNLYIMDNPDPLLAQKVWRWNLNGLGYSSTGINGTFGTAITMDGSIVADFITTGYLNTNVIQGYDELVAKVSKMYVFVDDSSGTGSLEVENVKAGGLIHLSITGQIDALYPSTTLYPNTTLFPRSIVISVFNNNTYKYFDTGVFYLNKVGDVSDEYEIYSTYNYQEDIINLYARLIRRIGNEGGTHVVLDNPVITELGEVDFNLDYGDSTLSVFGNNNATITTRYYINNEVTNTFATNVQLNSALELTANAIGLSVQEFKEGDLVNGATIMAQINNDESEVKIEADKININGTISANGNFKINTDGEMEAVGCRLGGYITVDNGYIRSSTGSLEEKNKYDTWIDPDNTLIFGPQKTDPNDPYSSLYKGHTSISPGTFRFTNYVYDDWETDTTPSAQNWVDFTDDTLEVNGNLEVTGTKNRVVEIDDGSKVKLNAYETTTPYFADIGSDKTNKNGECRIDIEEIFKQTIELENYKVFIQENGEGKLWVEKHEDYFIVKGTPNLEFDYEIKAIQKGYATTRLEKYERRDK